MRFGHQSILIVLFFALLQWLTVLPHADEAPMEIVLGATLVFAYLLFGLTQVIIRGKDAALHCYILSALAVLIGAGYWALVVIKPLGVELIPAATHTLLIVSGILFFLKTRSANRSYFVSS